MRSEWCAIDVEASSRWRTDRSLAIQDANLLIQAGEEGVYIAERLVTEPEYSDWATQKAFALALAALRVQATAELRGRSGETGSTRQPGSGRGGLYMPDPPA